ncbi:MAG: putative peptidoglycan glycosyltransferase FtsW [Patescibacteria group bacterium]
MANRENRKPDLILLGVSVALLIFGILVLASVSASVSQEKFGNSYYYLWHQFSLGIIPGLILAFLAYRTGLNKFKKFIPLIFLGNLVMLGLVFTPLGITAGGATRWLNLGLFSVQPAEFLKLTFILYLAAWLSTKTEKKTEIEKSKNNCWQTLFVFAMVLGIIGAFLFGQRDMSTFAIIAFTGTIMYFLANTPVFHMLLLGVLGVGGFLFFILKESYRQDRLSVFFKHQTEPLGIGYQISQALIAVGSGGIFGLGLGMSRQQFGGFLPESMSDSIFAVFAEETGFAGCFVLILLFLTFFWRGFKISKGSQDAFSKLAALGITFWIIFQTLINMGSMTGILPLSGIPLPFFSYGGSALVAELAGVGILLNISRFKS